VSRPRVRDLAGREISEGGHRERKYSAFKYSGFKPRFWRHASTIGHGINYWKRHFWRKCFWAQSPQAKTI